MIANNLPKPLVCLQSVSYHVHRPQIHYNPSHKSKTHNALVDSNILLDNISFEIKPYDVISLIGPNGAGKSTLVKLILGLIKPTAGKISRQAMSIGYVPQKFSVPTILPLQVKDLLTQVNSPLSTEQHSIIYDNLSINRLLYEQVGSLSGGELQRVLLCRALLERPDLLVLDEPMQGLDPNAKRQLYALIDCLPAFIRCAMLVVSHDLHWVMKGTKQVICLNKHICCMGEPSLIAKHDEFIKLFHHDNFYQGGCGHDNCGHDNEVPYIHEHDHCHHH